MEKKPNWDLKLPAPGTAFKILLLSSTFESAARTLASRLKQGEAVQEELWRSRLACVLESENQVQLRWLQLRIG